MALLLMSSHMHPDLRKHFIFVFDNNVSSILEIFNKQVRKKKEEIAAQKRLQMELKD